MSAVDALGIIEYNDHLSSVNGGAEVLNTNGGLSTYYASINAVRHFTKNDTRFSNVPKPDGSGNYDDGDYNAKSEIFATEHGKALVNATFEWRIDTDKAFNSMATFKQYQGFTIGHVFQEAGEYQIELSVTSAGGTTFADGSTVKEYADIVQINTVSLSPPVDQNGNPLASPIANWGSLKTAIDNLQDNTEIVLQAGATFTLDNLADKLATITANNIVISGENSTDLPTIDIDDSLAGEGPTMNIFSIDNATNIVFKDLNIKGRGTSDVDNNGDVDFGLTIGIQISNMSNHILVQNVHFKDISHRVIESPSNDDFDSQGNSLPANPSSYIGVFDSTFTDVSRYVFYADSQNSNFILSGGHSFVGNTITGLSGGEHGVRIQGPNTAPSSAQSVNADGTNRSLVNEYYRDAGVMQHTVIADNVFQSVLNGPVPKSSIQIRGNNEFTVMRNNTMDRQIDFKPQNKQGGAGELVRYGLVENNVVFMNNDSLMFTSEIGAPLDDAHAHGQVGINVAADYITLRDNVIDNYQKSITVDYRNHGSNATLGVPVGLSIYDNLSVTRNRSEVVDRGIYLLEWETDGDGKRLRDSNNRFKPQKVFGVIFFTGSTFIDFTSVQSADTNNTDINNNKMVRVESVGSPDISSDLQYAFDPIDPDNPTDPSDPYGYGFSKPGSYSNDFNWLPSEVDPSGNYGVYRTAVGQNNSLHEDVSLGRAQLAGLPNLGSGVAPTLDDYFVEGVTGDYNGNGQVEQGDLDLVLQNWGDDTTGNIPDGWVNDLPDGPVEQTELDRVLQNWGAIMGIAGDYNGSGQVEQGDLDLVLQNWGNDTAVTGTPTGWVNDLPQGQIEQTELDRVLQNWGDTNNAPDFAEPPPLPPGSATGPVFSDLDFLQGMSGNLTFTAAAAGAPDMWLWDTSWYSGYFAYDEVNDTWTLHQSSQQTEANGNSYLQFAEYGDRTFRVIKNPVGNTTWDISFDYSIPQSDGNSTVRIWALAEGESVGFGVEGGTALSYLGDINATLLSETSLADHDGWTTVNINGLQIPVGYGAIVIEWQTNAASTGDILGIDNVVVNSV